MRWKRLGQWTILVLTSSALPTFVWGQKGGSVSERSYGQARHILNVGVAVIGESIIWAKTGWRKLRGTGFNQGQSLRPDGPYHTRPIEITLAVDHTSHRIAEEVATIFIGGTPVRNRQILDLVNGTGHTLNLITHAATPLSSFGFTTALAALRRYPDLLLRRALERVETLRYLSEEKIEGRTQKVILFTDSDGIPITLFFDAETGLLTKCEAFGDHPVFGDTAIEFFFFDYRSVPGGKWPFRVVMKNAGEIVQDLTYTEVAFDVPLDKDFFVIPPDVEQGPPPGDPTSVELTRLAEGVYAVGGSTYNSLAVVFDEYLLVVEAPVSEERSEAVLAKLKALFPEKPVRYLIPTHYHIDHVGGIRRYIAEGATIVTTPGNEHFIRAIAATPHTVKPDALARAPKELRIEILRGKRIFSDGRRRLELYDIGPSPHVEEILIAYLPEERILFESDLFNIPSVGRIPPASEATRHFAQKIAELGLEVKILVPGHGRLGTMDDLRKALEQR